MTVRRGGLGRGLGALLQPTADLASQAEQPARLLEVAVSAITANPQQPRQVFDDETLDELAQSVREVGVLQPIVVRELEPGRYQLVMGERRWRACRRAGVDYVPAIIRDTADAAMLRDALLENLHREQLNPLEEAAAYQQLLEEFGVTHEELAARLGRSRSHVSNTVRLLNLSPAVQRRVAAGVLSAGHARALLALTDRGEQERLANRIVAETMSVRAVEEAVAVGDHAPAPRTRRTPQSPPDMAELAARLSEHFETRVRVELGRSKGKIVIEFGSVDDLDRLVSIIAPEAVGDRQPHEAKGGDPTSGGLES